MNRVTLKDVAEACGVAFSTVSNALSGKGYVKEETRRRILEQAEEMGYRPSLLARGLRIAETRTLGLLLTDIANPFAGEMAKSIETTAFASGYNVLLCNTNREPARARAYLDVLRDKSVDGAIIMFVGSDDDSVLDLGTAGFPFVLLGRRHSKVQADYLGMDNRLGVRMAMDSLYALGHRLTALVDGPVTSSIDIERREAFQSLAQAHEADGMRASVVEVGASADCSIEGGLEAVHHIVRLAPKPTAVIATSDPLAIGVVEGLRASGIRVPEDISVIGFDDIPMAALPSIQLTTIRQPRDEMGKAAVALLLERIAGGKGEARTLLFPPTLIIRKTAAPPHHGCTSAG